mgnify:CR=1 FL=1
MADSVKLLRRCESVQVQVSDRVAVIRTFFDGPTEPKYSDFMHCLTNLTLKVKGVKVKSMEKRKGRREIEEESCSGKGWKSYKSESESYSEVVK